MKGYLNDIIEKYQLHPRRIFLIDGVGAFISGILLVLLLANLQSLFGLPKSTVYSLSVPAFALMFYSLSCYFLKLRNWKPFLAAVAVANILYCILTVSVIISHHETVTVIGLMYFLGEIGIVLFIAGIEWRIIRHEEM